MNLNSRYDGNIEQWHYTAAEIQKYLYRPHIPAICSLGQAGLASLWQKSDMDISFS